MRSLDQLILFLGFFVIPLSFSFYFRDLYISPKWAVFSLLALLAGLRLLARKEIILPLFPKPMVIAGLVLVGALLVNFFVHRHFILEQVHSERIFFVVMLIFFFNYCKKFPDSLTEIAYYSERGVLLFHVFAYSELLYGSPLFLASPQIMAGPFGNINMSAEYVGICFVFQLYLLSLANRSPREQAISSIAAALSLAYIYFSVCRSVSLGIFSALVLLFLWKQAPPIKKICFISMGALLLIASATYFLGPPTGVGWMHRENSAAPGVLASGANLLVTSKAPSSSQRLRLLSDALDLWVDHPFGVGTSNYEYAILAYDQRSVFPAFWEQWTQSTPHSTLLLWGCEEGIQVVIPGLLLLLSMLWYARKNFFSPGSSALAYCYAALVVLIVQNLFQFPMAMAFSYLSTAMVGAYILASHVPAYYGATTIFILRGREKRLALLGLALLSLSSFGLTLAKILAFEAEESKSWSLLACRLSPANLDACRNLIGHYFDDGQVARAREEILKIANARRNNFLLEKDLAYSYHLENKHEEECNLLFHYDDIFVQQSSIHLFLLGHCQG